MAATADTLAAAALAEPERSALLLGAGCCTSCCIDERLRVAANSELSWCCRAGLVGADCCRSLSGTFFCCRLVAGSGVSAMKG